MRWSSLRASLGASSDWQAAPSVNQSFTVGYAVSDLGPPAKMVFNAGSTVPVKFQLTNASNLPIDGTPAASLGCAVTVTFNGDTPECAEYVKGNAEFRTNIETAKTLAAGGSYPLTITVMVGSTVVTTSTVLLVAK